MDKFKIVRLKKRQTRPYHGTDDENTNTGKNNDKKQQWLEEGINSILKMF